MIKLLISDVVVVCKKGFECVAVWEEDSQVILPVTGETDDICLIIWIFFTGDMDNIWKQIWSSYFWEFYVQVWESFIGFENLASMCFCTNIWRIFYHSTKRENFTAYIVWDWTAQQGRFFLQFSLFWVSRTDASKEVTSNWKKWWIMIMAKMT